MGDEKKCRPIKEGDVLVSFGPACECNPPLSNEPEPVHENKGWYVEVTIPNPRCLLCGKVYVARLPSDMD